MIDPRRIKAAAIREAALALALERREGRPVDPSEVSRALVGTNEKLWRQLMKPVKEELVRLAEDGTLMILRKGRPIPPREVRGLYRFRLRKEGEADPGPGPKDLDDDGDFDDLLLDDEEE